MGLQVWGCKYRWALGQTNGISSLEVWSWVVEVKLEVWVGAILEASGAKAI